MDSDSQLFSMDLETLITNVLLSPGVSQFGTFLYISDSIFYDLRNSHTKCVAFFWCLTPFFPHNQTGFTYSLNNLNTIFMEMASRDEEGTNQSFLQFKITLYYRKRFLVRVNVVLTMVVYDSSELLLHLSVNPYIPLRYVFYKDGGDEKNLHIEGRFFIEGGNEQRSNRKKEDFVQTKIEVRIRGAREGDRWRLRLERYILR